MPFRRNKSPGRCGLFQQPVRNQTDRIAQFVAGAANLPESAYDSVLVGMGSTMSLVGNPKEVVAILKQVKNDAKRDAALASAASSMADRAPRVSIEAVSSIIDDNRRGRTLAIVLSRWHAKDSGAARQYMSETEISESVRSQVDEILSRAHGQ